MTTYYVHSGITGLDNAQGSLTGADTPALTTPMTSSDSYAGTDPTQPWLTLAKAQATMVSGDTLYAAGRFYVADATTSAFVKTGVSGTTLTQWSGQAPIHIKLSNKAGLTGGWAASGSGFTKTLTASLTIAASCYDCDLSTNIDSVGRRKAWLPPAYVVTTATLPDNGYRPQGAFSALVAYAVGDVVTSVGVTYVCILYDASVNNVPLASPTYWSTAAAQQTAALGAGGTAQGGYSYNPTTGVYAIGPATGQTCSVAGGNMTAGANGPEYSVANRIGIKFLNTAGNDGPSDNVVNIVSGLTIANTCDALSASPGGTGIYHQSGQGSATVGNTLIDTGLHGVSHGGVVSGTMQSGNTFIGQGRNSSPFVVNASGTTSAVNNSATATSTNDLVYANTRLAADGNHIGGSRTVRGCEVHGPSTSVKFVNLQVIQYSPPSDSGSVGSILAAATSTMDTCYPWDINDASNVPSNALDPTTYPVQFIQTNPAIRLLTNGTHTVNVATTAYISFTGIRADFSHAFNSGYGFVVDTRSFTGKWLFSACELTAAMFVSGATSFFCMGPTFNLILINTGVYDTRTYIGAYTAYTDDTFAGHELFRYTDASIADAPGATVTAYGCIFASRTNTTGFLLCSKDTDASYDDGTGHTFHDNVYFNVPATTYSANTHLNAKTGEWDTLVDTTGVYPATNPFADTTGAAGLGLTAIEQRRKLRRTVHAPIGVNSKPDAGNYGPNQYPPAGWLNRARERLTRER